jgi:hypothetical protein
METLKQKCVPPPIWVEFHQLNGGRFQLRHYLVKDWGRVQLNSKQKKAPEKLTEREQELLRKLLRFAAGFRTPQRASETNETAADERPEAPPVPHSK